jgi:hypothetical protein
MPLGNIHGRKIALLQLYILSFDGKKQGVQIIFMWTAYLRHEHSNRYALIQPGNDPA